jgi:arginine-tRNA-protein transferase
MQTLLSFTSPPEPCGYLPDQLWSLHYEVVDELTVEAYQERLLAGWRRFGYTLFRPACLHCQACQSLRVDVARFRPSATQKRVWRKNQGEVRLTIGEPSVTAEKLALYDKFHAFQAEFKAWPAHAPKSIDDYAETFVINPIPTQEWCYWLGERLIGVGYVDCLPDGMSAIYFFYDPDERPRSPGVWNILSLLQKTFSLGLPYLYLGYYVKGCRSLEYKAAYRPHERRFPDGSWRAFNNVE